MVCGGHARAFVDDPEHPEPTHLLPVRGYFSELPFESINMLRGSLQLTVPILHLPGNAGMDVDVVCHYDGTAGSFWSHGSPWTVGVAGLPVLIPQPDPDPENPLYPVVGLFLDDGSSFEARPEHPGETNVFVAENFWKYFRDSRTIQMPNGWTASFETVGGIVRLSEVHDAFGNSIVPHWVSTFQIGSIDQHVGNDIRTVTFNWDNGHVTGVTYVGGAAGGSDRTWTFDWVTFSPTNLIPQIAAIHEPVGSGWQFAYTPNGGFFYSTIQVTTPTFGTVTYNFEYHATAQDPANRVVQRTTGGPWVTPGTWTFQCAPVVGGGDYVSSVLMPDGTHLTYRHRLFGVNVFGPHIALVQTTVSDGSWNELSRTDLDVTTLPVSDDWSSFVVRTRTVTEGGHQFITEAALNAAEYRAHFHQPDSITESGGGLERVTSQSFRCDFPQQAYLACLVDSKTVTVNGESTTSTFTYDDRGFWQSTTVAGVTTNYAPDPYGNRAGMTDANQHSTTIDHQWGVPSTVHTPEYTIIRTVNPDGSLASETRGGNTTTYTYDAGGRPTVASPPLGALSYTYYSPTGDWVAKVRGVEITYEYVDGFGRARLFELGEGLHKICTYDPGGRKVFESYVYSDTVPVSGDAFTYDGLNRVKTITHPDSASIAYAYSGTDVTVTDESGHATTQHNAAFGDPSDTRLAAVTDANGQLWSYSYNAFGSLTRVDQPIGPDRTWTYDTHNWLLSETQPESGTTAHNLYDAVGNLTQKTDARGQVFAYTYDNNNRLTAVDAPGKDHDVAFAYDTRDNRTSMSNNQAITWFTYDAAERMTVRTDAVAGHLFTSRFAYNDTDKVAQIEYPSGRVVNYTYDAAGRVTSVTGTEGVTYANQFLYHPSGAAASFQFGNGQVETATFDARYRPQHWISGPVDLTYGYDLGSNVANIADARSGHSSTLTHDPLDRLTGVSGFGATSYGYDPLGNRTSSGTGTFGYDVNSQRLMSASGAGPATGNYGYDAAGNQTSSPDGTFAYTPFNMMSSATINGGTTTYEYDADGQRIRRINPSSTDQDLMLRGVGGQLLSEFTKGGVDPFGLAGTWRSSHAYPTPQTISVSGNQLVSSAAPGQAITVNVSANTIQMGANTATVLSPNRLDWNDGDIWEREPRDIDIFGLVGRWRSASSNQAVVVGVVNGELRSSNCVYAWINHAWNPAQPEVPQHVEVGALTGNIYSLNQINWSDGDVWTRDNSLAWTRDSIYLGSKLLATISPTLSAAAIEYAHTDSLGSVRATTDQNGNVLARHDYAAFGEDMGPGPATGPERQRFTGKERDSETFFDYYGARYYRNVIGRFTTADSSSGGGQPLPYATLANPQTINLYAYAGNNPLRFTDADGHCFWDLCTMEGAAAYVAVGGAITITATISAKLADPGAQQNLRDVGNSISGMVSSAVQWVQSATTFADTRIDSGPALAEPTNLRAGRDAHNADEVRPGEKSEVRTPSGKGRVDRYDEKKAHIREIKPNNPRGVKSGVKQLDRYKTDFENGTGRPHTTELTLYPKGGGS